VAVAAAMAVGLAAPAGAKGPAGVTIRPPGGEPVALPAVPPADAGHDERLLRLADDMGLWEAMDPAADLPADPPTMYGPGFLVEWTMVGPDDDVLFVQVLHPQAVGGPLVHTPPNRPAAGPWVAGGWYRASARLADTLASLGWKTKMAVPEEPAGPAWPAGITAAGLDPGSGRGIGGPGPGSRDQNASGPAAVAAGVAAAGAVAVAGARAVRRRNRDAVPARG